MARISVSRVAPGSRWPTGVLGDGLVEAVGVGGAGLGDDGVDAVGLLVGAEDTDVGEDRWVKGEGESEPLFRVGNGAPTGVEFDRVEEVDLAGVSSRHLPKVDLAVEAGRVRPLDFGRGESGADLAIDEARAGRGGRGGRGHAERGRRGVSIGISVGCPPSFG